MEKQRAEATSTLLPLEVLLTIDDVAALLQVSRKTIYNWAYRDLIPCVRLSRGLLRFRKSDLSRWVASRSSAPTPLVEF